jgi:choline dehydrogenase-like flavoprotein
MTHPASASFDAVIIGSGAGGSAAAYKLASAGLRVAVVEKGNELPRDSSTLDFDKVVHRGLFKSKEQWFDGRGRTFAPEEYFNVGGKTKWYGAALLRYGRHEFEADPAHQCLGWPIDYDELRPYYEEAESGPLQRSRIWSASSGACAEPPAVGVARACRSDWRSRYSSIRSKRVGSTGSHRSPASRPTARQHSCRSCAACRISSC